MVSGKNEPGHSPVALIGGSAEWTAVPALAPAVELPYALSVALVLHKLTTSGKPARASASAEGRGWAGGGYTPRQFWVPVPANQPRENGHLWHPSAFGAIFLNSKPAPDHIQCDTVQVQRATASSFARGQGGWRFAQKKEGTFCCRWASPPEHTSRRPGGLVTRCLARAGRAGRNPQCSFVVARTADAGLWLGKEVRDEVAVTTYSRLPPFIPHPPPTDGLV